MTGEEGLELHSLSPGLMLFQPIPHSPIGLKQDLCFDQPGGWEPAEKHALGVSCHSMTLLPRGKLAVLLGAGGRFFPIHKTGGLLLGSSCKSKDNPVAKHKTNDQK